MNSNKYILIVGNRDHEDNPFVKYALYKVCDNNQIKFVRGEFFKGEYCTIFESHEDAGMMDKDILNVYGDSYKTIDENDIENELMLLMI